MPVQTELYDILEISPEASSEEIKKAFRKKALQHHPDKGGDAETFKKINSAYEILSDPEKKSQYDRGGEEGLKNIIPEDILKNMFGNIFGKGLFSDLGNMFGNNGKQTRKTSPIIYNYTATLENIARKKEVKLKYTRKIPCECTEKNAQICKNCKGSGSISILTRIGPFLSQNTSICSECTGRGKKYNFCNSCSLGILMEEKIVQFVLSSDIKDGNNVIFNDQGNRDIDGESGDFIVSVRYEPHPVFKLDGDNLLYEKTITLKESLLGHSICLDHPNGEKIDINISQVIDPYTIVELNEKGLTPKGNLKISYKIIFPKGIREQDKSILEKIEL